MIPTYYWSDRTTTTSTVNAWARELVSNTAAGINCDGYIPTSTYGLSSYDDVQRLILDWRKRNVYDPNPMVYLWNGQPVTITEPDPAASAERGTNRDEDFRSEELDEFLSGFRILEDS